MNRKCEILDLKYNFGDVEQHLFPVVLFGDCDVVLIDCGYPGSLDLLEEQLRKHNIQPEELTRLILTHQDDDHMGAAAEPKEAYPLIKITASRLEAPYSSGKLKNLRLQQSEALQNKLPEDQKAFGEQFCARYRHLRTVPVNEQLFSRERFDWGGGCEIIESPGHTPGHISIRSLDNEYMITGDAAVVDKNKLMIANPEYCLDLAAANRSLEMIIQYHCHQYICYHGGILRK